MLIHFSCLTINSDYILSVSEKFSILFRKYMIQLTMATFTFMFLFMRGSRNFRQGCGVNLFSLFVIKAGIHKMNVRITNREYPDQSLIWIYPVCQGLLTGN